MFPKRYNHSPEEPKTIFNFSLRKKRTTLNLLIFEITLLVSYNHKHIQTTFVLESDPIKQNTGPATNKPRGIVNEIILFNKENARP